EGLAARRKEKESRNSTKHGAEVRQRGKGDAMAEERGSQASRVLPRVGLLLVGCGVFACVGIVRNAAPLQRDSAAQETVSQPFARHLISEFAVDSDGFAGYEEDDATGAAALAEFGAEEEEGEE
ncbi:unnamed protein product, partial [Phaeothamnion confervicola]